LIKRKGFISLLGAEYDLMRKAGANVLLKFYVSSFVICLIAMISFLSVRYAMELLFHVTAVEITMSLFLALLFFIMYIFLINTFAIGAGQRTQLNFSNVTRTAFVVFMGFILSKPIEIWVYKTHLASDVARFKQRLVDEHSQKVNQLYLGEINNLNNRSKILESINVNGSSSREIDSIKSVIVETQEKMDELKLISQRRIANGSFFIFRVHTVSTKYLWSWGIC